MNANTIFINYFEYLVNPLCYTYSYARVLSHSGSACLRSLWFIKCTVYVTHRDTQRQSKYALPGPCMC